MGASFCYFCMAPLESERTTCPCCKAPIPYIPGNAMDIPPGALLHARYIMGRCLGRGGFGATYIAYDIESSHTCAIKEYFPHRMCVRRKGSLAVSAEPQRQSAYDLYKGAFIEESRRLFALTAHPGVVRVIEAFEENGTAYYAMEYIKGPTLKQYMQKRPMGLEPREALRVLRKVLKGLQAVHEAGMLHRDVSADNILCADNGDIKLIDFGSARETHEAEKTIFTKGVYTAPEQKLGDKQRPCTDLYAAGVLMFFLLTGRVPADVNGQPEKLRSARRGLSERVYALYETATFVNPNFRYQKAADMLGDLEAALRAEPKFKRGVCRVVTRRASPGDGHSSPHSPAPSMSDRRIIVVLLSVIAVLLLLLVILLLV